LHAEVGAADAAHLFTEERDFMARADLTKGPVWRALAQVSTPMTFGVMAVLSVGLADVFFLGGLAQAPLAAVAADVFAIGGGLF
jgi:Na+-driven multidrug efflux pump